MNVPAFVDTNILIYADDRSASAKRDRSRELIRELLQNGNGWVSIQVLQEYFSAAGRAGQSLRIITTAASPSG
jgi:predicted nucleic acid-binding protein